jgi:hypothetical protein
VDSRGFGDNDVFFHGRTERAGCIEARGTLDYGRAHEPYYRRMPGHDGDWDQLLQAPTVDHLQCNPPTSVPACLWAALVQSLVPRKPGGKPMVSPIFRSHRDDLLAQGTHVKVYFVGSIDAALSLLAQVLRPAARRSMFAIPAPHARLTAHTEVPSHHTVFSQPLLFVPDASVMFTPPLNVASYLQDVPQPSSTDYGCMTWSEERLDAARVLDPTGFKLFRIKKWPSTVRAAERLSVVLVTSHSRSSSSAGTETGAHVFVNWCMYGGPPSAGAPGGGGVAATTTQDMTIHLCHDVACFQPQHLAHGNKKSNAGAQAAASDRAMSILDTRRRTGGVAHWTQLRDGATQMLLQWQAEVQRLSQLLGHVHTQGLQAQALLPPPFQLAAILQLHARAVTLHADSQLATQRVSMLQQYVTAAQHNMAQLQ